MLTVTIIKTNYISVCDVGDTFDEFRKFPFKHLTTTPNKKRCKCYLFNHIWQSRDNSSVSHLFSSAVQEWKLRRDKCGGDITTTDNVNISSYSKRWSQRRLNNYIKISSHSFARACLKSLSVPYRIGIWKDESVR